MQARVLQALGYASLWALLWLFVLFWPSPAHAKLPAMDGVRLQSKVLLPEHAFAFAPEHRPIPGDMGAEFDLPISVSAARSLMSTLPLPYQTHIQALGQGARVRVTVPHGRLRSRLDPPERKRAARTRKRRRKSTAVEDPSLLPQWTLRVGIVNEEQSLREFADHVRLPIPLPSQLDAQLELWKEAEQATYKRQVKRARKLWEKLAEQKKMGHLAELRIAELFLLTGHINEAIARLRQVSANYPRSMGAALGRLTALQLETLIREGDPTAEQIILAAQSGHYRRFRRFANLRAAFALVALEREELALARFPDPEELAPVWRKPARALAATAVARAIYRPLLRRQIADAIAQYEAWTPWIQMHPQRAMIERDISKAYLDLGLYEPAIALTRAQLERFPGPRQEALLVQQLVRAYHDQGSLDHELESLLYLWDHHPDTPGAQRDLRSMLLGRYLAQGWEFTNATATPLLEKNGPVPWKVTLLEALTDLAMAEDRPQTVIELLKRRFSFPPEPSLRHRADYALAVARDSPSEAAVSLLRNLIGKVTAPELHDQLAFALAKTEGTLGHRDEQTKILDELSEHGTVWGLLARAQRREIALQTVVAALEKANAP